MDTRKAAYERLDRAWDINKPATTAILARAFLKRFPDSYVVWTRLALLLIESARYEEARVAVTTAMRLMADRDLRPWAVPAVWMGLTHENSGDFPSAERWYRRATQIEPRHAIGHIYLGSLLALCGRFEEAKASHRRATRCKLGCIEEAWLNLGLILRAQQRFATAERCLNRAIEIDPDYAVAKRVLADVRAAGEIRRTRRRNGSPERGAAEADGERRSQREDRGA